MTTYSYAQLESLWEQAGGSTALAPVMAAIAMAESGGNPAAVNSSTDATGLWQINLSAGNGAYVPGGGANATNPLDNAKAAVAIEKEQGLGAWTTYTSGAYHQFLEGNVPASAAGTAASATDTAATTAGISIFPTDITGFFSDANSLVTKLLWIVNPTSWIRIGAFLAGAALLLFSIHAFIAAAKDEPIFSMPNIPAIPVPV